MTRRHGWALRYAALVLLLIAAKPSRGAESSSHAAAAVPGSAHAQHGAAHTRQFQRRHLQHARAPLSLVVGQGALVPAYSSGSPLGTPVAQWLHVVYQLFGPNIEPFNDTLRTIFVVQLNLTLVQIDLEDIEILSVEEFLPLTGPNSETLGRLAADSSPHNKHAVLAGAVMAAAPGLGPGRLDVSTSAPPLRSNTGRRLLQTSVGAGCTPSRQIRYYMLRMQVLRGCEPEPWVVVAGVGFLCRCCVGG